MAISLRHNDLLTLVLVWIIIVADSVVTFDPECAEKCVLFVAHHKNYYALQCSVLIGPCTVHDTCDFFTFRPSQRWARSAQFSEVSVILDWK